MHRTEKNRREHRNLCHYSVFRNRGDAGNWANRAG